MNAPALSSPVINNCSLLISLMITTHHDIGSHIYHSMLIIIMIDWCESSSSLKLPCLTLCDSAYLNLFLKDVFGPILKVVFVSVKSICLRMKLSVTFYVICVCLSKVVGTL